MLASRKCMRTRIGRITVLECMASSDIRSSTMLAIVAFIYMHHETSSNKCEQLSTLLGKLVASVCIEPQQCWHLLALVVYSLKPVKLLGPY